MFATRWLTYLAGTGFSPAGLIDLARPHTPFPLMNSIVTEMYANGATVNDIWEYLDGLLYHHEIEDILIDACLIQ